MPTETKTAKQRPLTGAILGILIGLALAVILQQQGVWPLDKLTVFLLPAVTGVIGLVLTSVKRAASMGPMIIAFIILIPMAAWGATGISTANEKGALNGGCEVQAQTPLDSTVVTDTSRQDPFLIDPNGSLVWGATSPTVWMDYYWEIWVEIGGVEIVLDSDVEPNEGGSQINGGDVPNITEYADARGIDISQLRGVYKVGGEGNSPSGCDGHAFIEIVSDPFETLIAKIALGLLILLVIILLLVAFTGRTRAVPMSTESDVADGVADGAGTGEAAAGSAEADTSEVAGAPAATLAGATGGDVDGDGDVDSDDLDITTTNFDAQPVEESGEDIGDAKGSGSDEI
jgi:hypothetical protein